MVTRSQVLAPWNCEDAKGLLKAAIRDGNPIVFLESEIEYGNKYPLSAEAQSPNCSRNCWMGGT